jgi:hypothetical protein
MLETQTAEWLRQVITWVNIISWFFCFYILGYDTSLFRPQPPGKEIPVTVAGEGSKFHLKWDLVKKRVVVGLIAIVPGILLFLGSVFTFEVLLRWVIAVVSFALGFLVWEHLKETGILVGSFKHQLVFLSVPTTIAIAYIAGYGAYVGAGGGGVESLRCLLLSIMLFVECIAWYMLGLCVAVFRRK